MFRWPEWMWIPDTLRSFVVAFLADSTEWFIEDQALFVWFRSLPPPPPLLLASFLSFSVFLCVAHGAYWWEGGKWVGEEPNHTTARKPGPGWIIQYSLHFGYKLLKTTFSLNFTINSSMNLRTYCIIFNHWYCSETECESPCLAPCLWDGRRCTESCPVVAVCRSTSRFPAG